MNAKHKTHIQPSVTNIEPCRKTLQSPAATVLPPPLGLLPSVPIVAFTTPPNTTQPQGYWRGDVHRTYIRACLNENACAGGTGEDLIPDYYTDGNLSDADMSTAAAVTTAESTQTRKRSLRIRKRFAKVKPGSRATHSRSLADGITGDSDITQTVGSRYCSEGYMGVYCSVCIDGYRKLSSDECSKCNETLGLSTDLLFLIVFTVLTLVAMVIVVLFLIGGPRAMCKVRDAYNRRVRERGRVDLEEVIS